MGLDEYEAVRLIDLEGMQQEQAAAQMGVARTTVQAMYNTARRKMADCVVNGRARRIEGGAAVRIKPAQNKNRKGNSPSGLFLGYSLV